MATLKDIAKLANVNISTVSKALNNHTDLNSSTAAAIRKIADELGYAYGGTSNASDKEDIIGVVFPEVISAYYMEAYHSLCYHLDQLGYKTLLMVCGFEKKKLLENVDTLTKLGVKGVVFFATADIATDLEQRVTQHPDVTFLAISTGEEITCCDCISINSRYGMQLGVEHLTRMGHKKIAYIGDLLCGNRMQFFMDALGKCEVTAYPELIIESGLRFEECGYEGMKSLMAKGKLPDAVFASYDYVAIGVIRAITEAGYSVPEDISVISVDGIKTGAYLTKSLSTIAEPTNDLGEISVKLLMDKIKNNKATKQCIKLLPVLKIRESTAMSSK